ncbi:MAG: FAD-dependent oxidoreductase [Flavisolibacter sp.]|nr:FAD-dependent oxidoreductase [Flavisolibacter sp.]
MSTTRYDVIIIGAGAAGMLAALEIALTGRVVAVIEAKDRTGGRIHTINYTGFEKPVEMGAEFVHGDLPTTVNLFEKAGIKKHSATGEAWEYKEGALEKRRDFIEDYDALVKKFKSLNNDISVADFMKQYLADSQYEELRASLKNYVQGYYAGDIDKASTYALYEELTGGEEKDYRVDGGYGQLAAWLEKQTRAKGVQFFLLEEVREINWKTLDVEIVTNKQTLHGKKVLVTVSIGVLQSEMIRFSPALPGKMSAAKKLGFGHAIKTNLQFTGPFWKDKAFTRGKKMSKLNFLFSNQPIPTWWTQHPRKEALLVGWLAGPPAESVTTVAKDVVVENAMQSLAQIFSMEPALLQQKLLAAAWYNWSADKHFYGAYSYSVVDGEAIIKSMIEPVENTIYFAGEGLHHGNEIGTVEAALTSGRNVARQLIAQFDSTIY